MNSEHNAETAHGDTQVVDHDHGHDHVHGHSHDSGHDHDADHGKGHGLTDQGYVVVALILAAINPSEEMREQTAMAIVLIAGLAVFAVAMRWDMSDRSRETRRSNVAFWLHLLAAPMIAHPLFWILGVTQGDAIGAGAAFGVVAVYIAMGLVALAIDRRALLVSALAYVLVALTFLFQEFGVVELNVALTALVIGSALLTLSAFWTPIRRFVVDKLPGSLQVKLPVTQLATA